MRDSKDIQRMLKCIKNEYGRLDILVNNAGITKDGYMMMMGEESFNSVFDTNLGGYFRVTREALKSMCPAKKV